ncbi:small metal-binding protein SmbP [Methylosarcina fibrata]|uniref:small metal-binding protein SmbP n=1 Tax=Methylosarcina fibrata TaxID=105972 RepID=UPI00039EA497|nr:small metal-binding protein SmbP [Methylosarcina fibrata]
MKKTTSVFAGLLLVFSSAVMAEDPHAKAALEHANAAAKEGAAGRASELVKHASVALEHTLAGALVDTGMNKEHLEAASNELEEAVNHGNMGHADVGTEHVKAAITHIQAVK